MTGNSKRGKQRRRAEGERRKEKQRRRAEGERRKEKQRRKSREGEQRGKAEKKRVEKTINHLHFRSWAMRSSAQIRKWRFLPK